MSWYDLFDAIESHGWRKQVMEFAAKLPELPVPVLRGTYTPSLEWGVGARLSRDYLDFEVYEINDTRVTEQEFLDWLRIQYSL